MSYSKITLAASAGGTIYFGQDAPSSGGGGGGRPAWRTAMANGTVALIPGNTLKSIDPALNPAINPNYPGDAPWRGATNDFKGMITAWNGMAWDEATCTAWFPLTGGHTDYAGNEPYKNCLRNSTATFVMLRNPSGAIGNLLNCHDGQEASGVFSDGRVRPGHAYNNNGYVAGLGPVICRVKGPSDAGNTDNGKMYVLDEGTGETTLFCDLSSVIGTSQSYGGMVHDAAHNRVITTGNGNTPLTAVNLTTKVATNIVPSDNYIGSYVKPVIMPSLNLIAFFHTGGAGVPAKIYFRDLDSPTAIITPTITGAFSTGLAFDGEQGVDWDDFNQCFYLWNNSSNTNEVSVLTPTGNPRTAPWNASVRVFTGITVSNKQLNGTWGRFGYSKNLGGLYLLNAIDEQFQFFATE